LAIVNSQLATPAGGPPTVPQALNRYAATSLGPPGVGEAVETNPLLNSWIRDNWYRQESSAFITCATCVLSEIKTTEQLFRLRVTLGNKTYKGQDLFRQIGKGKFQNIASGDVWTEEQFLLGGILEPAELEVRWTGSRQIDNLLKNLLSKSGGRIALNVGVAVVLDVGFEGLEYATGTGRWANPYWTPDQKKNQAIGALTGDLIIVGVIAYFDPPLLAGIGIYFIGSTAWGYIQPVFQPDDFIEIRNLKPLEQSP
jgi:hypothetical protein